MTTTLKTDVVRARIEPNIKKRAETILKRVGVSPSTLINMTYRALIAYDGLPIDFRMPEKRERHVVGKRR